MDSDLEILIARRFMNSVSAEEIIDWALEILNTGIDSTNIRILAGLKYIKPIDTSEVEYYFEKCIKDLGYCVPEEKEVLMQYVEIFCYKIINKALSPKQGLDEIYRVILYAGYPENLKRFLYISDGLSPHDFSDLTDEEFIIHIFQEANNFIIHRKAKLNTNDKSI